MHYLFLISLRLLINPFGNLFLLFTLFLLTLPFKNISWDNYIHMQLKEIIQRSYVLFTQFPQMLSCCKAKAQYYNQESTLIKSTNLIWLSQYYMYLCECLCVLVCVYLVCAILTTYVGSCIHHNYQDTKFLLIVLVSEKGSHRVAQMVEKIPGGVCAEHRLFTKPYQPYSLPLTSAGKPYCHHLSGMSKSICVCFFLVSLSVKK